MKKTQTLSILFELIRSFTSLADTLNLSKTVRNLGSTRQTVRRHIRLLEERMGETLFTLEDRQYHLTEAGVRALPQAQDLLVSGEAWLNNATGHINGLAHINYEDDPKFSYYLQQHPLGRIWQDGSPLLQQAFQCWAEAKGELDAEAFAPIRPYLVVYRQLENSWICVDVGQESSFAKWQGWRWARSSVGTEIPDLPGGAGFANLLRQPFRDVRDQGTVRLDHIHTQLPDQSGAEMVPISFQRLLMACRFPDGAFALGSLVVRTYDIGIHGVSDAMVRTMPEKFTMDGNSVDLKKTPI